MAVASAKHGQRVGGPRVLMLLVHALSDDEQQAHFSKMPWFVRKLLLKRIWAGSFRGCLKGGFPETEIWIRRAPRRA